MKNISKNLTVIILFLVLICLIMSNSNIVKENIVTGFELWVTKVFPTLFPMFVISNILVNYGFAAYLGKIFNNITKKLFKVNGYSAYVFFMSLISGTPSNSIYIKDLYDQKLISEYEASKILCFTFFINPFFAYFFLYQITNNSKLSIITLIIIYLVNIIIGILIRNLYQDKYSLNDVYFNIKPKDFPTILTESIKKSINNLIIILGSIVFFIMLTSIIETIFLFNPLFNTFLKGVLEITNGLEGLVTLTSQTNIKLFLAAIFISFGGLSIHMQIKSIVNDTSINYKLFFITRIIHLLIAVLMLILFSISI